MRHHPISRRRLLTGAAAVGAGASLTGPGIASATEPSASTELRSDPFGLGIASGDPTSDGVVLWTRLALDPLADDGRGGMPGFAVPVLWQLATDERMRDIVQSGVAWALPSAAHSVHVEVGGLQPHTPYWYRFRVGRHLTPVGRTVTAPRPDEMPDQLRMGFVSCSEYEHGYFHAYRALAADELDVVLELGDYIYEVPPHEYIAASGNVRDHAGGVCVSLGNYRQRYAQYKTDPDLQAAHAASPWIVTFDDHEVSNDWRNLTPEEPWEQEGWLQRRAAAFRAYYENMPLRRSSRPRDSHIQIFRRLHWGRLATFHVLDTRQYADPNACGGGYHDDCDVRLDPRRSILGERQERWLRAGFRQSQATWDILAQQTHFAQRDADPEPRVRVNTDCWDGYAPSRDRVTRAWVEAGVRNAVVLTGDVHAHWASDLKLDYADPGSPTVGAEFVTSSVTSNGDGWDLVPESHAYLKINKHLRFYNNLRGYVRTTITPDTWDTDFRCVAQVSKPDRDAFTRRSYRLVDGDPTMKMTYDQPPINVPKMSDSQEIEAVIKWENHDEP